MKESLSKEQSIKSHRALWNWIADTIEKEQRLPSKAEFEHPDHPNTRTCMHHCYACEYAKQQVLKKNQNTLEYCENNIRCSHCPLEWPNQYNTRQTFTCCTTENNTGLFDEYTTIQDNFYLEGELPKHKWEEAVKLARQIANLPEKSE